MPDMWMPGAVRDPQPGGVQMNPALPSRVVWHITSDALDAAGNPPPFANVDGYLQNVMYCPTIMWDPVTGYITQYYPANLGGRALSRWNEDGQYNIQIEIYFSYGVVRNGVRYADVRDTPLKGYEDILNWVDTLGIPRVWPMGEPLMGARREDANIWNTQAGHYGHSQVPGENHVDPGPMPSLKGKAVAGSPVISGKQLLIGPSIPDLYI